MIYQRKPAPNSLGVYGVAQRSAYVSLPRNVAMSVPRRRRMAGLSFHGFGAAFGAGTDYPGWDITQTYTDTTDPYNPTPTDTTTTPATSTDTSGGTYPYGPGSTYYQTNTPGLNTGGGTPSTSGGGSGSGTGSWTNNIGTWAQDTTNVVGGFLKMFGVGGGGGGTQGTGGPTPGNSMISLTVLGAVVLGAGALYLANSRKKA